MPTTIDLDAILALPPEQRIAIAEAIWDSLGDDVPLTAAQAAELERRLERQRTNPTPGTPWEVVAERVRNRARAARS